MIYQYLIFPFKHLQCFSDNFMHKTSLTTGLTARNKYTLTLVSTPYPSIHGFEHGLDLLALFIGSVG